MKKFDKAFCLLFQAIAVYAEHERNTNNCASYLFTKTTCMFLIFCLSCICLVIWVYNNCK